MDKIEIEATLPTGRTAFAFTGDGDSKVSLDCDATQLGNLIPILVTMRGQLLRVTFEALGDKKPHEDE
jgi:hypothetical protein